MRIGGVELFFCSSISRVGLFLTDSVVCFLIDNILECMVYNHLLPI